MQVATLTVERTLKGSAQGDIDLHQAVSRTAQGAYTTAEPLYRPLATGQRYAVAVLDRTEDGDRWVWGAERAPESRIDQRWSAAVAAKAVLPTATCDDTRTITSTPKPQRPRHAAGPMSRRSSQSSRRRSTGPGLPLRRPWPALQRYGCS